MHDPVREHNVLVLFVLLAGTLVAQYPGEPKTETVEVAKNQFVTKKYCAASTTKCECSKDLSQQPQDGCVQMVVEMGRPRYSALTDAIALQLNELEPTSRLYSPDGFCVVAGYTVSRVTREKNAGGVPKWVRIITKEGVPSEFVFEDGDSVGRPLPGMHEQATARLAMVDAQGWATAADPAYYDYYPGDGSRWRFGAAPGALDYLQFVEHQTPVGRMETKQDIGLEIVRDGDGVLRQVVTPTRLADLVVRGQDSYDLAIYPNDASCLSGARTAAGVYEIVSGAVPEVVWKFRNPTPGVYGVLEVTREKTGADPQTWRYQYVDAVKDFTLTYPGGLVSEHSERLESDDGNSMVVRKYKADAEGVAVSKGEQYYEMLAGSYVIVKSARDPDGLKLTRRYEYYKDAPWTGLDRLSVFEDSSWTRYEYDDSCRVTAEIRPWLDAPTNAPNNQCAVTRFNYTVFAPGDFLAYNDQRPRTEIKEICGIEVARTYHAYPTNALGQAQEIEERAAFPGAPYGHASTPRTVKTCYAANAALPLPGRLATVVYPGGKTETYGYEYGAFNAATFAFAPDPDGGAWRETVTTSYGANSGVQALRSARVWDEKGHEVLNESYVEDGAAFALIGWTRMSYDRNGKLVETAYSDGRVVSATRGANCCGKESKTSDEGIITVYGYNELKQKVSETKKGMAADSSEDITTLHAYDLANRVLSTAVTNIASGLGYVASRSAYDAVGRVTNAVDRLGNPTATEYANDGTVTVRKPNGVVSVTGKYGDGRARLVSEDGVVRQAHAYGVTPEGQRWTLSAEGALPSVEAVKTVAELRALASALDCPWTLVFENALGQSAVSMRPGFGRTVLVTANAYDVDGSLLSNVETSCRPDGTGTELVKTQLYAYAADGLRLFSALDMNTNGVIDLEGPDRITGYSTVYEKDADNTWWKVSCSWVYPEFNSSSASTTSVQRVQFAGLGVQQGDDDVLTALSQTLDARGNVTSSSTIVDRTGRKVMQVTTSPNSVQPAIQANVNGLLITTVSSTAVTNTFGYDALGRQTALTDGRGNTTSTAYNPQGMVAYTEDAATNRTSFAYDVLGRRSVVTDTLGNVTHTRYDAEGRAVATWGATYPVAYAYDTQSRMVQMGTYRGATKITDYASFQSLVSSFDKTHWLYDNPTGLLTNKLYADGNGPSYTYSPDGKMASRLWARGVLTSYVYDAAGFLVGVDYFDDTPDIAYTFDRLGRQLSAISSVSTNLFADSPQTLDLVSETQNGVLIIRPVDAIGRSAGLGMRDDYAITFGYDDFGRFSTVSSSVCSVSSVVNYDRLLGSDIVSGYSAGPLKVVKTYEPNRDLVTQVRNETQAGVISQYDYSNDALGRRVSRYDSGLAFAQPQANTFGYNQRSEVTSAIMYTNAYGYVYDPIGNRLFSSSNAETNTYVANSLNQYSNVVVQSSSLILHPSYDADGNMTFDGKEWFYFWNGENRLILASNVQHVVAYAYDHQGRMLSKVIDGAFLSYLWDGYNIVSEKLTNSGTNELTNFYTWGLDLSGSLQGAGGVGGLLAVTCVPSGASNVLPLTSYPSCDANGNITEYISANGSIVAHREYSAFGETTVLAGTLADSFTHWWSTKPWCSATKVSEYELRKYSPVLGQWLNRDPLNEEGGFNLYCFVYNRPIDRIDYRGEMVVAAVFIDAAAVALSLTACACILSQQCRDLALQLAEEAAEAARCAAVLEGCIAGCLPELLHGVDRAPRFRRCIHNCMDAAGCSY